MSHMRHPHVVCVHAWPGVNMAQCCRSSHMPCQLRHGSQGNAAHCGIKSAVITAHAEPQAGQPHVR